MWITSFSPWYCCAGPASAMCPRAVGRMASLQRGHHRVECWVKQSREPRNIWIRRPSASWWWVLDLGLHGLPRRHGKLTFGACCALPWSRTGVETASGLALLLFGLSTCDFLGSAFDWTSPSTGSDHSRHTGAVSRDWNVSLVHTLWEGNSCRFSR